MVHVDHEWQVTWGGPGPRSNAETRDQTGDLQIFGLTLSQLSYRGLVSDQNPSHEKLWMHGRHCQQQIPSVAWDALKVCVNHERQPPTGGLQGARSDAETRDRTGDLQIFSLTLSQLSYRGLVKMCQLES